MDTLEAYNQTLNPNHREMRCWQRSVTKNTGHIDFCDIFTTHNQTLWTGCAVDFPILLKALAVQRNPPQQHDAVYRQKIT